MSLPTVIDLKDKFSQLEQSWRPAIIAQMNDYQFKVVKLEGEFVWHTHGDTDETFLILDGTLSISVPDGEIVLGAGQMSVIPRGMPHCPQSMEPCYALLIEPEGTLNTGDAGGPRTTDPAQWL